MLLKKVVIFVWFGAIFFNLGLTSMLESLHKMVKFINFISVINSSLKEYKLLWQKSVKKKIRTILLPYRKVKGNAEKHVFLFLVHDGNGGFAGKHFSHPQHPQYPWWLPKHPVSGCLLCKKPEYVLQKTTFRNFTDCIRFVLSLIVIKNMYHCLILITLEELNSILKLWRQILSL